jgi:hypothetical protein
MYHYSKFAAGALLAALLANPTFASAASDSELDTLKKRVAELESKTKKLEDAEIPVSQSLDNKLKLSSSITEIKIYGDVGLRYQYDQGDAQLDVPAAPGAVTAKAGTDPNVAQRSRFLFKLRLFADVKLGNQFFGGFGLSTNQASDANFQPFTGGYDKYGIYITKAFLGYTPTDWLTVIAGKQTNPFYTTDLLWDPDINPQGLVEIVDIGKALFPDSKFSLQFIAGQLAMYDNNEFNLGHDASNDAWQFVEQLKATYKFDKDTSLTFAPGFSTYTPAHLSGLLNARAFSAPQDQFVAPAAVQVQTTTTTTETKTVKYDAAGKPSITTTPVNVTVTTTTTTPTAGSPRAVTTTTTNTQKQVTLPFGATGNPLPQNAALANQTFVSTTTKGGGTVTVTNPVGSGPSGETRNLAILTAPGDFSFKLFGLKTKAYWDFAYNTEGTKRFNDIYSLAGAGHSTRDDISWLAGLQFGDAKKAGDWALFANYREVGMSSIDPNLNDSDVGLSALNIRAIKIGAQYLFTDAVSGAITYSHAWNLRENLVGGQATGGAGLANLNNVDVLQVDLNMKF